MPTAPRKLEREVPLREETADRFALIAAGSVIIVLTGAGFWLSYAHLAEVAGRHGLLRSPVRQWAWPATLDLFIVAGELLMLRAGLRRVTDWWAVGLTAAGSTGSIVLNVAGVSGTTSGPVPLLDYVVAAVPPTGAMLAFGVLMRQIHQSVAAPVHDAEQTAAVRTGTSPDPSETRTDTTAGPEQPGPAPGPTPNPSLATAPPDRTETRTGPPADRTEVRTDAATGPDRPGPNPGPRDTRSGPVRTRTVRAKVQAGRNTARTGPRRLSEDEVVALVLPDVPAVLSADGNSQITRAQLRGIMRARGIPLGNDHIGPVLTALRAATAPTSPEGAAR